MAVNFVGMSAGPGVPARRSAEAVSLELHGHDDVHGGQGLASQLLADQLPARPAGDNRPNASSPLTRCCVLQFMAVTKIMAVGFWAGFQTLSRNELGNGRLAQSALVRVGVRV